MPSHTKEDLFPDGILPKTYSEIVSGLRKDLITIHEHACASGDLLNALERHTNGGVVQVVTKSSEANFAMITALEGVLSFLAAVEENDEAILAASLLAYRARNKPHRG